MSEQREHHRAEDQALHPHARIPGAALPATRNCVTPWAGRKPPTTASSSNCWPRASSPAGPALPVLERGTRGTERAAPWARCPWARSIEAGMRNRLKAATQKPEKVRKADNKKKNGAWLPRKVRGAEAPVILASMVPGSDRSCRSAEAPHRTPTAGAQTSASPSWPATRVAPPAPRSSS